MIVLAGKMYDRYLVQVVGKLWNSIKGIILML